MADGPAEGGAGLGLGLSSIGEARCGAAPTPHTPLAPPTPPPAPHTQPVHLRVGCSLIPPSPFTHTPPLRLMVAHLSVAANISNGSSGPCRPTHPRHPSP